MDTLTECSTHISKSLLTTSINKIAKNPSRVKTDHIHKNNMKITSAMPTKPMHGSSRQSPSASLRGEDNYPHMLMALSLMGNRFDR